MERVVTKDAGMEQLMAKVVFQPYGKRVRVPVGATVREAASLAGIILEYPCGGEGTCGKCRVKVSGANGKPSPAEIAIFSKDELRAGFRLACQMHIDGDINIEIPESSLPQGKYQILAGRAAAMAATADPPVRAVFANLPQRRAASRGCSGRGDRAGASLPTALSPARQPF